MGVALGVVGFVVGETVGGLLGELLGGAVGVVDGDWLGISNQGADLHRFFNNLKM